MPRNDRRRGMLAVTAAVTAALVVLTGCASSNKESPNDDADGGRGGTLRIALAAPPTSLDPANMEQSTSAFAQPAYDALIRVAEDGALEPGLATEWEFVDDENRVFEITLRSGVTFSDGSELDAEALVASLEHFDQGSSNVATLINGGSYEAIDDDTVRITWDAPHPLAPQAFTQRWVAGMVISAKALETDPEGLATETAGAGPYVLDSSQTVAGSRYTYAARDDYWDPDSQHWDEVVITVVDNAEQRFNAMRAGEFDYAVGDLTTAAAAEEAGLQVLSTPTIFYGLSLLDRDGELGTPLGDVRVRRAINYAIDREAISDALLGDYGFPTEQTVVPGEPGYVEELEGHYALDRDRAKQLLEDAGHADGFSLKLVSANVEAAALVSQVLAEQLASVGITLEIDARSGADYFTAMTSGEFPMAIVGYGSQPMPMEYDGLFGPNAVFNPLGTQSDSIDAKLRAALVASPEDATSHYEAIGRELVEDAWFAPVVFAPVFYFGGEKIAPLQVSDGRPQTPLIELRPAD